MGRSTPRVTLLTDTIGDVNGVTRFIRTMAREADTAGRELSVLTSTRLPLPDLPAGRNFPPRLAMPMPGYSHLELAFPPLRAMLRHVRRHRPDVIHVSTPGPVGLAGVLAARVLGVPLVGIYHTDFPAYVERLFDDHVMRRACECYVRACYGRFDRVLARSGAYLRPLEALGLRRERLGVLPAGCDLERFHPRHADRDIWRRLGLRPETAKVLYCGRISVEKDMPTLASAWRAASARLAGAELVVVGDGPYRERMQRELRSTRAHFLGFRHGRELSTLYASSDLFVFPSATDTLGQVVLEAQASGLPAIVSDAGGPREIILDGQSGLVAPAGDGAAFAGAIAGLLTDAPRRAAMAARARENMRGRSTRAMFEHFWEAHERVWRDRSRADPSPRRPRRASARALPVARTG